MSQGDLTKDTVATLLTLIDDEIERLDERAADLSRIRKALKAEPEKARAKEPKQRVNGQRSNWHVSPEKREAVLQAVREADGPVTSKEIQQRTGIGRSTISYALTDLRKHELVRLAGRHDGAGGAHLFAAMPS